MILEREIIHIELNKIYNEDCITYMGKTPENSFDLSLTDIPYNEVNRESNGLRTISKEQADVMTFEMQDFLENIYRVTRNTIIIFCGQKQLSDIYRFFSEKQKKNLGTVRQLIWEKTNPSPMNGQYIYISGIENAVWFKKRGGTFNAHCKNTVFRYPCGRSKIHPTEKNHKLLEDLILDNSNEGDIVFDPCAGSGSHCLVAKELNRNFIGCELNSEWYKIAEDRVNIA